jgi:hypothetical protein
VVAGATEAWIDRIGQVRALGRDDQFHGDLRVPRGDEDQDLTLSRL